MHKCRSYGPNKLNLLPFYHLTFKWDLDLQPTSTNNSNGTSTLQGKQLSQIILKSMYRVMAQTSSIYNHFIIWPPSVTLTINLPKQMFQMALLLLKENTCAKLFLESMHTYRSYGPDKLSLWQFYHLTFKRDLDFQPTQTNVSNGTTTPQGEQWAKLFWNLCINVGVMPLTS